MIIRPAPRRPRVLYIRHKQCFAIKNYAHHIGSGSGDVFFRAASIKIQSSVYHADQVFSYAER